MDAILYCSLAQYKPHTQIWVNFKEATGVIVPNLRGEIEYGIFIVQ